MSKTPIVPFTSTITQIITSFSVSCRTVILFTDATFTVDSFDIENKLVSRQVVPITPEQYQEWNNNDEYIIDLMAQILGYTIITPIHGSATQKVVVQQ